MTSPSPKTEAGTASQGDGAVKTPMRDHIERFWRLLRENKVRILVDVECPGFGGVGWYASSSFGDDVSKALAERAAQRDELLAALKKGRDALEAMVALHSVDAGGFVLHTINAMDTAIARAEARATGGG